MTHIEFKQFLTQYKSLSGIIRSVFERKRKDNEVFGGFTIVDGKIMLIIHYVYETYLEDVTSEVYAELMPDDLIF